MTFEAGGGEVLFVGRVTLNISMMQLVYSCRSSETGRNIELARRW